MYSVNVYNRRGEMLPDESVTGVDRDTAMSEAEWIVRFRPSLTCVVLRNGCIEVARITSEVK